MKFQLREVIWAKVKGYPWWPAYVNKLPEEEDGNFKVFFFAEETYALLEPKCVQKFAENYAEYSKTKAKKFMKALDQANNAVSSNEQENKAQKEGTARKKGKQKMDEDIQNDGQSQHESSSLQKESQSSQNDEELSIIEQETDQIDKNKVEKAENELSFIMREMQNNRVQDWKHSQYFQNFLTSYSFNSEQLMHSNITRMVRYIIECMQNCNTVDKKDIKVVQNISKCLKDQVISYLTNTTYYDNHIKLFDRSKTNKSKIESRMAKIMKKRYEGQVKKEFLVMLATNLGNEVGKKCHSQCKQLVKDLNQGIYDEQIKVLNSKAGCLRICDLIIKRYE